MAKFKVIQVNIFKGKYLESLVDFLKKEDADFVTMQEVTAGWSNFYNDKSINTYEYIKEKLGYFGVFHNDAIFKNHPNSLHGNVVLSKFPITNSHHVVLRPSIEITDDLFVDSRFYPDFPRGICDSTVDAGGYKIHVLSVHGAWTAPPTDTPEALRQAELIANYLKTLDAPFIMGGDMNTTSNMQVIKIIETVAVNLIDGSGITYTTHPTMHRIAPRKLAVDYIFTSRDFKRISIEAPLIVVSDHLPVVAELEFSH